MTKKIYKLKGLDCPACATLLESDFEDAGIKCKCSYARQTLEIEGKCDFKMLKEMVEKSGYNIMNI